MTVENTNEEYIKKIVSVEFGKINEKFQILKINIAKARQDRTSGAAAPGVYIFLKDEQVIKVGRSLTNSRKRALEHIDANTGGEMALLEGDESAQIILFNLMNTNDTNDLHWVCALEVFLEIKLKKEKRLKFFSARTG